MIASDTPPDEKEGSVTSVETPILGVPIQQVVLNGESIGTVDEIGAPFESRRSRLKRIGKPIAGFFGVQVIVQILTMLAGLLVVRAMSKPEYALYTVASSMQAVILVLCDSGISGALSAIGGVVWQDRQRFGSLIQTALEFRRKLGLAIFLLIGPLMWWMLYSNGAGIVYATVLSLIILAGTGISLTHGVLIVALRLHARVTQIQNAELLQGFARLVLLGIAYYFIRIDAVVAIIIVALMIWMQNALYRKWVALDVDLGAPSNLEDHKQIWKMVQQQAPMSIFFCFQSQLLIFLISFFGNTNEVANLGALGRLMVIFTVINSIMINVVMPRFARCQTKQRVKSLYFQILGIYLFFISIFIFVITTFSDYVLLILGSKYSEIRSELFAITLFTSVNIIINTINTLNLTRGWVKGVWISIPLTIGTQACMMPFINLGSINDVVIMGMISSVIGVLPAIYRSYMSIRYFDEYKIKA